ncbi:MAG: Deoxyadenosine/deoxycytidine kinase [bacterium]|nr:Deoxyadenosine/deoxycytidine kinase [bacterium]
MPQNPNGHSPFVAIAGNIGVGKTTLTKMLVERFGWTAFFEKEVANPYLADFYQDMPAWAFQSQIFFLKERLKDHLQIQAAPAPSVQDRTIYEDAEIFAHNLFERGLMHARDYACYADLYAAISSSLRPPDLFVYLRASTWTLISRIRKRGRDYEQNIDKEYLAQLNLNYERWAKRILDKYQVMIVDTDAYDVHRDKDWLENMIEEIQRRVA